MGLNSKLWGYALFSTFLMSHVVYTELKKLQLENTKIWISWAEFFAVMAPLELKKIRVLKGL